MPPIISKIIPLKGGFPKGGIKSGPRNPPRGKDYKQSPPYRGIFTCIYFLQCSSFDFILTHKPGRQMGRPDTLLRWADHPRGVDDNVDFTLLTPEVFELRAMEAITLEGR